MCCSSARVRVRVGGIHPAEDACGAVGFRRNAAQPSDDPDVPDDPELPDPELFELDVSDELELLDVSELPFELSPPDDSELDVLEPPEPSALAAFL